jgi:pyruvate,orthophosphate dikinase
MSHAAVVARDWNLPAVVGAAAMQFTKDGLAFGTVKVQAGDTITVNGSTGEVYLGKLLSSVAEDPYLEQLKAWAEEND